MSRCALPRPRPGRTRFTAVAGILVVALAMPLLATLPANTAAAANPAGTPVPAGAANLAGAPTTAPVPVMIVLDASGSMNQDDAPGPRIDAAKTAVTDLLGSLPTDSQVGLMVYGTATGSTDADKAAGCQDVKTLAPVTKLDTAALTAQVNGIAAAGYTPIGNALKAAADALPNEGPRSIVLVSDGEDTCAPPAPCDVARDLHQQGIDLTVHTVGFKVDATARDQLSCIAQATGGTYSDAGDATQLGVALQTKVDDAITGYTTAGTPVTGADQASEQAPLLTPGQYVDTYAVGGSGDTASTGTTKYYTVPVQAGMHAYISATLIPPDDNVGSIDIVGVDLDLLRKDLKDCRTERGFEVLTGSQNKAPTAVIDGPTFGDPKAPSTCPTDGVAILRVARIGKAWADKPLPMEIVVRMEPPADTTGLLPQASQGDLLAAPVHGTPSAITGGSSFNDAPELTSAITYTDTLVTGESRYFRVPLQWGQRMSYLITEAGPAQPSLGYLGTTVWVDTFNPVRTKVTRSQDTSGKSWFKDSAQDDPFASSTDYPVRYTNRSGTSQRSFSLDGDYYLRVNADRHEEEPSSTTFLITVVVSGDVEPGPTYLAAGAVPTSGLTTSPSATASVSASSSAGSAGSGSASVIPTDTTTGPTAQGSSSADPVPGWVWALGGALAAGAVAVLVVALSRRRSSGGPGPSGGPR